jgi:hypothetical protein
MLNVATTFILAAVVAGALAACGWAGGGAEVEQALTRIAAPTARLALHRDARVIWRPPPSLIMRIILNRSGSIADAAMQIG